MKIMVGYCGLDPKGPIEAAVLDQARAFKGRVYLVHSIEVGEDVPKEKFDTAEANLENGKTFFTKQGIDCETILLETGLTVAENLLKFAKDEQVDEIIIGVRKRSKLGKLIFDSTAQDIILNSSCPVLCVNKERGTSERHAYS